MAPLSRYDLHIHTDCSDGRFDPEQVLWRCARSGLGVIALTDHDTVAPVDPGLHLIDGHEIHVLTGAEISGTHQDREFHLLVYFAGEVPERFLRFCDERVRARRERYARGVESLGLELPEPEEAERRALTRHHLARALVEAGHVSTVSQAFDHFLSHRLGAVPKVELPFVEAIQVARDCGGLTSWAHPPADALQTFLPTFVAAGLQGLEAYRPSQRSRHRNICRRLARKHGLFLTAGSDWHGWKDPDLGLFHAGRGELRIFLDALEQAA